MSELMIPEGWTYYKLPATKEKLEFWGTFIDAVDNDSGERLRWAELRLYKYVDSNETHNAELPADNPWRNRYATKVYLLYTIGHSLVVHENGTLCSHKGIKTPVRAFPQNNEDYRDLENCPSCTPGFPGWETASKTTPDAAFELETTWYSYTECPAAADVLLALRKPPACKHCEHKRHPDRDCKECGCGDYAEGPRFLSSPGERLVKQVSAVDPEIAAASQARRRL